MQQGISQNFTTTLNFNIDDEIFIVLPHKGEINFKGFAQTEELSQNDNIQQPLKSIANELVQKTIPIRQSWVLLKEAHQFNLPPSYFKKKIVISRDNDEDQIKKVVNQYDFIPYVQFDDEQLNQIWKEATFDVIQQNNRNTKNRWIVSKWIVKGTKNIKNSFNKDMLKAQDCVTGLGDFIYNKKNFNKLWNFSIVHGIYLIIKKSLLIPSLFIGYREVIGDTSTKAAQIQVEKERQLSLRNKNLNFAIYQYFYHTQESQSAIKLKVDYIKNQLKNFEQDCWKIAALLSDRHINQNNQNNKEFRNLQEKYQIIYDSNKDIEELISEQLNNAQNRYLQKNTIDLPEPAIKQIQDILECYKLQKYYQELLKNELANYENEVIQQYEKDFFFLNKQNHREEYIKETLKLKKKNLKKQYYNQMIQELSQKNIVDRNIYIEFIENKQKYKNRVKEIKKIAKEQFSRPNIAFYIVRLVVPPYPIILEGNKYFFLKIINYEVNSSYYFWKFLSFCLLYFTIIINSYYLFYQFGIYGHFGLKALFSIEKFYNDKKINSLTGEVTEDELIETICSTMRQIYRGMEKSRREFEESEDSDMFGKGCLRICNLIEVYIFRFLFVGVFCTLILKPMLILLISSILFFIFITSFMWAGFAVIIKWMVCLLFFDIDTAERHEYNEIDYIHWFMPLFRAFLDIMIGIVEIMVCFICLLIFPIFAIFTILFGILRFIVRYIYDCFMMIFVYCCGRVPYRSGCLAWRVGGDNIQKKIIYNYHKLTNEELILLTARELERYILEEYQNRIIIAIQQPEKFINNSLQPFFNRFSAQYQCIDQNSKLLLDQLSIKIAKLKSLHPELDSETKKYIKYTVNELQEIKLFLITFLIEQINLKNMHSFIWKRTGLQIGEYQGLIDIIITQIFGNDVIIKPEELVQEVQIKVEKEKGIGEQIERAMLGQVNLNQPNKLIIEQKKEIPQQITKKVHKQFIPISEIFDKIWLAQQTNQEWSSLINKDMRFLLNYSLKNE
ncbi:unnamed protein product [Paramecium pentaurelia]|uniref:Uncharacterized protein n=1 Tax=Paramecium pentaurelia TaxID=43138 RepID=A0A8S1YNA7_9CILI|nr:unnamed protein product [Paramecium pentaurelia]